ncbi:hypothetical protein ACFXPY_32115 [Streptomyces sp. NPDC059153]|uniref:hypothetical protein n=1 Tax=unclassified Streptomyces TaxID=2593676 RepID=UPI0036B5C62A
MTSMTHTHVRTAGHRRSAPGRVPADSPVSGEQPPRGATSSEQRDLPADTQVWNWAESVVFSGYGPTVANFL